MAAFVLLGSTYVYSTVIMAPLLEQVARAFAITVGEAGLASAAYGIPAVVLATVAGPYADRLGRKRFLVSGTIVLGISTLAAALAPSFPFLVALRFAGGVGAALCASSMLAALADAVPYKERASALALVGPGGNLFVSLVGVPVAGILAEASSWRTALVLVGALALVTAVALAAWVPRSSAPRPTASVRRLYTLVVTDRPALLMLAAALIAGIAWVGWSVYVIVFFQRTFGLSQGVASTFAISTGVGYFLGAQLAGRVGARMGNRAVSMAALVAGAAAYLLMTQLSLPLAAAFVMNVVLICLVAARIVTLQAMLSEQVPEARATLGAILGSVNAAAASAGTVITGLAVDAGGFPLFGVVAAILLVLSAGLLAFVREPSVLDAASVDLSTGKDAYARRSDR